MGDSELAEELSFQVMFCKGKETGKKVPGTSERTGAVPAPHSWTRPLPTLLFTF